MHALAPTTSAARHELVLVATILVAMSVVVGDRAAAGVAVLLPIVILLAGWRVVGGAGETARQPAALLLPAVLTGGASAAVHLVAASLWLLVALGAFAVVLDRILDLETGILAQPSGTSDADRARVLGAGILAAFIAFTGVAAMVPGGMPEPAGSTLAGQAPMTEAWIGALAAADAVVALLVGWRIAALRFGAVPDMARSALTYALVAAIAAGLIRAIDLPRLVGPAVLTLVFYLWDAQHGAAPARRRERRFVAEMVVLGVLAVVVIAWNLRLTA